MWWKYVSIPKLQLCNRWNLGMGKEFRRTLYWACNNLFMLGFKVKHVSKYGPWSLWWDKQSDKWLIVILVTMEWIRLWYIFQNRDLKPWWILFPAWFLYFDLAHISYGNIVTSQEHATFFQHAKFSTKHTLVNIIREYRSLVNHY